MADKLMVRIPMDVMLSRQMRLRGFLDTYGLPLDSAFYTDVDAETADELCRVPGVTVVRVVGEGEKSAGGGGW